MVGQKLKFYYQNFSILSHFWLHPDKEFSLGAETFGGEVYLGGAIRWYKFQWYLPPEADHTAQRAPLCFLTPFILVAITLHNKSQRS